MPSLYHFSEEPGIQEFRPRLMPQRPEMTVPVVWAIERSHQHMYLFPRDCPRALLWPVESTTEADREAWFGRSDARVIAHVEYAWLERIRQATLYRYELPEEAFESLHDAGMWVSRQAVTPRRVEVLGDLFEAMREAGVELRVMERLTPLAGVWEGTTLHWSGIRLRNARGWTVASSQAPEVLRGGGAA
ncbi:MAG: hypothetical protein M0R73_10835 [Dehalococcoidia bacterium]|nr:hypothetical protein [Dehalococcoidia bacterium]